MAKIVMNAMADKPQMELWRRTIGLLVIYALSVFTGLFMFARISASSWVGNVVLLLLAVLGQAIVFNYRLFYPPYGAMSRDEIQDAAVFGQSFTAASASRTLRTTDVIGMALKAFVFLILYFKMFAALPLILPDRQPLGVWSSVSCASCVLVMNNRFVWLPASLFFLQFIFQGGADHSHLVNMAYVSLGVALVAGFVMGLSEVLKHASADSGEMSSPVNKMVRSIGPGLLKPILIAILVYWIGHALEKSPSAHEKRKNQKISSQGFSQHRSGHVSSSMNQGNTSGKSESLSENIGRESNIVAGGQESSDGAGYELPHETHDQSPDGPSSGGDLAEEDSSRQVSSEGTGNNSGETVADDGVLGGGASDMSSSGSLASKEISHAEAPRRSENEKIFRIPQIKIKLVSRRLLAVILVLIVAGGLVYWIRRQRKRDLQSKDNVDEQRATIVRKELRRSLAQQNSGTVAQDSYPDDVREQVIRYYNDLILINASRGLPRSPNMTPDEYYFHVIARAPRRTSAISYVTNIYSRVFFGNQTPDRASWSSYCRAIEASIFD